jgi:hypothetical protein
MAAGTFKIFKRGKNNLGKAAFNLSTGNYYLHLFRASASAGIIGTLSTKASLVGECSAVGGYTTSGKVLTGISWASLASAGQYKWDWTTDLIVTASGAQIQNIKYAVIRNSTGAGAGKLLTYVTLSSSQFTLATNNTLTVVFPANGLFTLS